MTKNNICIVGSGSWGNAIASLLRENSQNVSILSRNNLDLIKEINCNIVFIALRSEAILDFILKYHKFLPQQVCSLAKGIISIERPFLSNILLEYKKDFAILSGPNFADEVLAKVNTISTIAGTNNNFNLALKKILENNYFNIELTTKINAIEVYMIFKNIIAIYMGKLEAQNLPENYKSMIFTKMVQEVVHLANFFEPSTESFLLSAGIGDIFLTATNHKSRNFSFGFEYEKSKTIPQNITVEGLRSIASIPHFANLGFKFDIFLKIYEEYKSLII